MIINWKNTTPTEETTIDWYHRIKEEHQGLDYFSTPCKCYGCSDNAICNFYRNQEKQKKKYKNLTKLLSINADLSQEKSTSLFLLNTNEIEGKVYKMLLSCVSLKFRFIGNSKYNKWYRIPWPRLKKAIKNTNERTTN